MTEDALRSTVEERLRTLPVVEYAWTGTDALTFSERVRTICRDECPRYGTSWSCPPAVGTVQQCRESCLEYDGAFVFTTVAEVRDITDLSETLETQREHRAVLQKIRKIFMDCGCRTLALSGDSCAICPECAYPHGACRFPQRMTPCIEGYGIVAPLLAERAGITFQHEGNVVTWFGLVLFTNLP